MMCDVLDCFFFFATSKSQRLFDDRAESGVAVKIKN